MKLIFSYWLSRPVLPGAEYAAKCMAAYAKQVGADYRFDRHDPYMGRYDVDPRWFDKLRPCYDPTFAKYDKVLVVDSDVFPVDGITANIFDEPVGDFGMVEEPDQPEFRERFPTSLFSRKADEQWAKWATAVYWCNIPRDAAGRPRTWNAGVILLTRRGMTILHDCRDLAPYQYCYAAKRQRLPAGYCTEQSYLNTIAFSKGINFTQLPLSWNRQVHKLKDGTTYDRRDKDTKFVHIQLPAADHNDAAWHHKMVNDFRK